MSAPNNDLETKVRKSRWPLIGIGLAVLVGVGATVVWLVEQVAQAPAPDERGVEQELAPPSQEGVGQAPAPEGVEPTEAEPGVVTPTVEQ